MTRNRNDYDVASMIALVVCALIFVGVVLFGLKVLLDELDQYGDQAPGLNNSEGNER